MHSPISHFPPVPKPRTRFNCGKTSLNKGAEEQTEETSALEIDTCNDLQNGASAERVSLYPTLDVIELPAPPLKPPREPISSAPPPRPPPPAGWDLNLGRPPSSASSSKTSPAQNSSPPVRSAPPPPPSTKEFSADKPMPPVPPRPWNLGQIIPLDCPQENGQSSSSRNLGGNEVSPNYIENPGYLTLQKYREMAGSSSNESGFYSQHRSPPLSSSNERITSSDTETEEDESSAGTINGYATDLKMEISPRNINLDLRPLPPVPSSSRKSFNDYTPPPKRNDYAFVPENRESIIDDDADEETIKPEEPVGEPEAEGVAVSFFGFVSIHVGKKEKKRAYARLKNMHLFFHDDEETSEYLCGPFQLSGCQLISRTNSTISIRLNDMESQKHLIFSVEEASDTWSILLSECWLTQYDLLRNSVTGITTCGTFYLRQGTASEWQAAAGGLLDRTLHYVVLDTPETIYELDTRKVLSIREKVEKEQWCSQVKKKNHRGPFILVLEGCSLYLECEDEWSTNIWYEVIDEVLHRKANSLDEYRLTGDNIPIIVDKCIRFISAYGMNSEGIYRRNGKISEAKEILAKLNKDAPSVHLKPNNDETVYAVADVIRQFFRRLSTPLIAHDIQANLFKIVSGMDDTASKCIAIGQTLQNLPIIHYTTLKKLMTHLADVTSHVAENKASIENLAKVFGASLFHTESETGPCFIENSNQISVVAMLITHCDKIFELTSREELSRVLIEEAQKVKTPQHKAVRADGLLVPIHIWEKDNRAFNVKTELAAEEVCREAVAKRNFDADINGKYAIFEILKDGALKRRLFDYERLSDVVINRWIPWKCHDGYLLFDKDSSATVGPNNMSCYSGKVKLAEPGSKTFKTMELKINEGDKVVGYKSDKKNKEWLLDKTIWFNGAESSRKPPFTYNVTFLPENNNFSEKYVGFCVSFKSLAEKTNFLNQIYSVQQNSQPAPLVHI